MRLKSFSSIANLDCYGKWNVYQGILILLRIMRLAVEFLKEVHLNHLNGELGWAFFLYISRQNKSIYCFVVLGA